MAKEYGYKSHLEERAKAKRKRVRQQRINVLKQIINSDDASEAARESAKAELEEMMESG